MRLAKNAEIRAARNGNWKRPYWLTMSLAVLLLVSSGPGAPAAETQPDEKHALALGLVRQGDAFEQGLRNGTQMLSRMAPMMEKAMPGKGDQAMQIITEEVLAAARSVQPEIESGIADVYAEKFTLGELQDLSAFYATPTGQKALKMLPEVMAEAQAIGLKYMKAAQEKSKARVQQRLKALKASGN